MAWTSDRIVAFATLCAAMLAAEIVLGYRARRGPFSIFDQLSGLLAGAGSMYFIATRRESLPWMAFALCLIFGLATYAVADFALRRLRDFDGSVGVATARRSTSSSSHFLGSAL